MKRVFLLLSDFRSKFKSDSLEIILISVGKNILDLFDRE